MVGVVIEMLAQNTPTPGAQLEARQRPLNYKYPTEKRCGFMFLTWLTSWALVLPVKSHNKKGVPGPWCC